MKFSKLLILGLILLLPTLAMADSASEKEAAKLLDSMGMEQLLEKSMDQMLNVQLQQNPGLEPFKEIISTFLDKYMSYKSLKSDLLQMYAEEFSASELKEINAFYATEVGKKTIQKMPVLMAKGGRLGSSRIQEHIDELQSAIAAESQRLQENTDK